MITAVQEHHPLDLDDAPTGSKIRPGRYLTRSQLDEYAPMRRYVRKRGLNLPRSSFTGYAWPFDLARALELWGNAPADEREAELERERQSRAEIDADNAAWDRLERMKGLVQTDEFLPAAELCARFDIKPGTLRQWANRGHVRTDTHTLRMGRGGYAKSGDEWEDAQGFRGVKVYHVGDTIDRARQSGMSLGEQHAPDAHNALRMLHHAYRECLRVNVPTDALAKHLLNLARGDDSAFPALETDRDAGLA